ncbi:hypothetical protein Goklo_028088 [Gossypium klotzschianum]|uniref:Uncharacterized protein n=1 Tax=Gossypium klotzschianum TaxID=34286 RepID=A0A7J8U036_9ROSI|nr:hypothetical protein [Gossypium klotzschianum]
MKITMKRLKNSTGKTSSSTSTTLGSTDTTQTSIGRTYSSKQNSFGLGLLSIPWSDLSIYSEFYRYLEDLYCNNSTDTLKTSTETSQDSSQSLASPTLLSVLQFVLPIPNKTLTVLLIQGNLC